MSTDVKRIAVYGPESTGKSMLAARLAEHFRAPLVAEYAREFWDAHGAIALGDIETIAREQWRREDAAVAVTASPGVAPTDHCNLIGYSETEASERDEWTCNLIGYKSGKAAGLVVCDTEALTTVLWSDVLYGTTPDAVRREAEKRCRGYALYLLLDIDVPFAPDPQRCFPDEAGRQQCLKIWHGALERRGLPYVWIRGDWAERERAAIAAVEAALRR